MKVRKYSAGVGVAALLASGLALAVAAPASADPSFTPSATDIVGVGSDTIEYVVGDLAAGKTVDGTAVPGWNASHPSERLASFNATPAGNITLRSAAWAGNGDALVIARPNGSGQGKATLFGAGNNANVNFARSSSSLSTSNGESTSLTQFPFAVDSLKMATSGLVASHAPATLTIDQVLGIYKGDYKQWSDINASWSSAFIHPLIPQSGSGTRSFFEAQLKAANGGVAVTYPAASGSYPGVVEVQEHDPSQIESDADAIAPFSTARAHTLADPSVITLGTGWTAQRAVYDVVRNADAGAQWATDLFGPSGFFCSTAAKPIIEANGFAQLATVANGGVCGVGTTTAVTNFTTNTVTTTTSLTATAPAGRQVKLTATVAAGGQSADGDVEFYEGANKVTTGLLSGGQSVVTLGNITPGDHTYTAKFVSANPASFTDSTSSDAVVTVKEVSTTTASVVAKSYGHSSTATVSVTTLGNPAAGSVTVKVGSWQATKALTAGAASFTLPTTLSAGAKSLVATYSGDATTAASTNTKSFTVAKSAVVVSETFPAKVKAGKRAVGTVVVALSPGSTVKPGGTVVIKRGSKVVGKGTLVGGQVKLKLAKLPKGKNKLVAAYGGSANTLAKKLTFYIVQK
jgi:ABC-type phosphate transport system substrate-binding protein